MPLAAGSKFGVYSILGPIGSGGMGEVYRAFDTRLGREVAVKTLPAAFSRDPERLARFEREARMLASLNHPSIAAIYGLEESDGGRFIVMELVPGETLSEKVSHGPLPLDEALKIARQIADALEAAHERGIIHRDLKPANIKVTPEGRVKVLDFGLAKAFDAKPTGSDPDLSLSPTLVSDGTQPGVILGTAEFMSPEQARGKPVDKRTDIWSFGCVLYELLTGRRIFGGETASDVLAAILTAEPRWDLLPREIPARIRDLLRRSLQKDPSHRLRDVGDARIEIDQALDALRGSPLPVEPPAPRRRASGKRLAAIVAGAVAAVVAALAIVWIARRPSPPPAPHSTIRFLAVLPFKDLSGQPDGQLLGDAFAETMSARLARVPGIQVVTPRATNELSAGEKDLERVARSTGASLVLGGAIQRVGEQLRITCSLVRAPDGVHIGGEEVTTRASDIFGAQDRLAESVLSWLGAKRGAESLARPGAVLLSSAAQESYLKAIGALRRYDVSESIATAVRILTDLDRKHPDSPLILAALGRAHLNQYEITRDPASADRAIAACEAARKLDDRLPEVHTTLGQVLKMTGKPAEATEEFERALAEQPSSIDALLGLADAYRATGNSQAEATYRRALALQPSYWAVYNQFGSFYYRGGRYADAIPMFRQAIRRRPDSVRAYNNLGAALFKIDRFAEARQAYQSSIRISPSDGAYTNLGNLEYYVGNYRAAAAAFEEATKLTPGKYLYWANLADAYRWTPELASRAAGAYEKAAHLAEGELSLNPDNAAAHATLAICYAKLGRLDPARQHIARALEIEPANPDHLLYAGIVAEVGGKSDEAIAWIRKAVKAGLGAAQIEREPELKKLRSLPGFGEALASAKSRA
ncbi:MAG TPA: protein kinase [Thermoanaerobaculia bacterium]|nr:protein kinase [Thermoanaerobaculia bacterium]